MPVGPLVKYAQDGQVLVVTIDNPPVNALSAGVPEGLEDAIDLAASTDSIRAVVVAGAGRTFIAGADINDFVKMTSGARVRDIGLNRTLERIENCPKPVVMALHGTTLGGGLETAMSGHYRVAAPGAQVGQPEVKLGLIPGAGGTQRLPRLAGFETALEMCVTGVPIGAAAALECGIIDRILEGDLIAGATAFAREAASRPARRTRERNEKLAHCDAALFDAARQRAQQFYPGRTAPLAAVDAIQAAATLPFDEGLANEQRVFLDCLYSDQSRALIHVFFAEREAQKIADAPKDATPVSAVAVKNASASDLAALARLGVSVVMDAPVVLRFSAQLAEVTAPLASATAAMQLARKMGKTPLYVKSPVAARLAAAEDIAAEAQRILDEGLVARASDLDIAAVMGCGYAPHLGGPLWNQATLSKRDTPAPAITNPGRTTRA